MNIPFLKYSKIYYIFSGVLLLLSIYALSAFGLRLGIDFLGGSILEVEFENRPANPVIEEKLKDLNLGEIIIQPSGERGVIIRTKEINEEVHQEIIFRLAQISKIDERQFESIGPTIGKELRQRTMLLVIVSLIALLLYVAIAFGRVSRPASSWQYGIISIIALCFDVLLTLGLFAFWGKFYNAQFSIPIITAILTILGYTINDKVIVFDRVRENLLKSRILNFTELVEQSLNQTIFRSLSTGICTLLVLAAIFLFGGETLKYFSLTLIVGIVVGTYSSLFLASPLLADWVKWRK